MTVLKTLVSRILGERVTEHTRLTGDPAKYAAVIREVESVYKIEINEQVCRSILTLSDLQNVIDQCNDELPDASWDESLYD